jgi:2'-5' RNA ligase
MAKRDGSGSKGGDIRSFVALDIPDEVKKELRRLQERLRPVVAEWHPVWVKPSGMHLTLKFLGSITADQVQHVRQTMQHLAALSTFPLQLHGLGFFPHLDRPRVFWSGYLPSEPLTHLQTLLDEGLEQLGFEKEQRGFTPHLTLARIKQPRPLKPEALRQLREIMDSWQPDLTHMVHEVRLYRSVLTSAGAQYSVLHTQTLAGTGGG